MRSLPGRFCRSRAALTAAATIAASATADSTGPPPETIRPSRCLGLASASRPPAWRGLVQIEAVVGEDRPLHERPRDRGARVVRRCPARAGTSQQSTRVEISRARSRASAAATRARSGVKSLRAPSPTVSQRLPSAWVERERLERALRLAAREQLAQRIRHAPTRVSAGLLALEQADDDGVGLGRLGRVGCPGDVHDQRTISGRRGMRLLALPVCRPCLPNLGASADNAQDRDPRRRPHPHRQDGRRPLHARRHRARRRRDRGGARARRRRARAGRARRDGPGAAGRPGPDPLAPGADQGRTSPRRSPPRRSTRSAPRGCAPR